MFIKRNLGNDKCAYSDALLFIKIEFQFQYEERIRRKNNIVITGWIVEGTSKRRL
jgi:hypothetical protein